MFYLFFPLNVGDFFILSVLQGALQDVRLVSGTGGYLLQCPQAEAECPTCGQFQVLSDRVDQLQQLVAELATRVRLLR